MPLAVCVCVCVCVEREREREREKEREKEGRSILSRKREAGLLAGVCGELLSERSAVGKPWRLPGLGQLLLQL